MKEYIRVREKQEKTSRVIGIALAAVIPACAAILCSFTGFKYIWPPPQETSFLIDYTEEIEEVIQHRDGAQPQAEEIDLSKPIELVQKSESPITANTSENLSSGTPDDHGDVEVPAPKEPEINQNALFPGMSKKDTSITAPHSASEASEGFKAGHPSGNTDKGQTTGTPNAHLQGRNVIGTLPRPAYSVQAEGIVVVSIWVDQYGNVTKAQAGADGTTVTSTELWTAARNAAMKAHFNQKADAPALQQGTITYIFSLK
ncbi:MAG: energy transducer TonB [Bacteroidia bacterium]|nr:energy transducer TonB [Bacteroidia bacterium]